MMFSIEFAHFISERPVLLELFLFTVGCLLWKMPGAVTYALLRIGLVRRYYGSDKIRWPISIEPWWIWKVHFRCLLRGEWFCGRDKTGKPRKGFPWGFSISAFGMFRNLPGVIKWEKGRLLPRRWGFHIFGLEIGDRG